MKTKVILSIAAAALIALADIMSRDYLAFGGGSLLLVATIGYWVSRALIGEDEK